MEIDGVDAAPVLVLSAGKPEPETVTIVPTLLSMGLKVMERGAIVRSVRPSRPSSSITFRTCAPGVTVVLFIGSTIEEDQLPPLSMAIAFPSFTLLVAAAPEALRPVESPSIRILLVSVLDPAISSPG